jgi:hypothetical protein
MLMVCFMLTAVILNDANSIRKSVLGSWSVPGPVRFGSSTPRGCEWLFIPRRRTHFRFSSTSCSLFPQDSFRFRTGSILISSSISYHDGMRTFEWRISYVFNTVWNSYLCAAPQTIGLLYVFMYVWMYKIFRYLSLCIYFNCENRLVGLGHAAVLHYHIAVMVSFLTISRSDYSESEQPSKPWVQRKELLQWQEGFILRCETASWRVCRGACLGTVGRAQPFSLLSFIDIVSPSSITAKAFFRSDLPCFQRSRWDWDNHDRRRWWCLSELTGGRDCSDRRWRVLSSDLRNHRMVELLCAGLYRIPWLISCLALYRVLLTGSVRGFFTLQNVFFYKIKWRTFYN